MAVSLSVKKTDEVKVHFIPIKVENELCDDTVDVEKFFNVHTEEVENNVLKNSIRGRPLDGIKMIVPNNFTGLVLRETVNQGSTNDNSKRNFRSIGTFKEIVYWNYDNIPNKNDPLAQALDWVEVAETLHAPLELNEITS